MKFDTNIMRVSWQIDVKRVTLYGRLYRSSRFFAFRTKHQRHVLSNEQQRTCLFPYGFRIPNLKYLFRPHRRFVLINLR